MARNPTFYARDIGHPCGANSIGCHSSATGYIMIRFAVCFLSCALCSLAALNAITIRPALEQRADWFVTQPSIESLTVLVQTTDRCGAGLVVGAVPGKTFLATAAHVVRDAAKVNVRVRLWKSPWASELPAWPDAARDGVSREVSAPAAVLRVDERADLAILEVAGDALSEHYRLAFKDVLGDPKAAELGDGVYAIGCSRNGWNTTAVLSQGTLRPGQPTVVSFAAGNASPGYSGGPLVAIFRGKSRVVGLIRSGKSLDEDEALAIEHVRTEFASSRLPFALSAPETDAECQYDVDTPVVRLSASERQRRILVSTAAHCRWSANSGAEFLLKRDSGVTVAYEGPFFGTGSVVVSLDRCRQVDAVLEVAGRLVSVKSEGCAPVRQ